MYSIVLMAALTSGGEAPDCHFRSWGCHGCSGSCHGCWGGGCHGCWGGCHGYSGGCHGCWGSCHGCSGCSGGCYGGCYGCYGGWGASYGCYGPAGGCHGCYGGYGAPMYMAPAAPAAPGEALPPPKSTSLLPNTARVVVELPADATLSIDGKPMKTTSNRRVFRTPELEPGQVYYYTLKAQVIRDGQPVEETKRVILRAGEVAEARFGNMESASVATAKAR